MRCRRVEGRAVALLREELDAVETLAVNAHLEVCAACRVRLARAGRLQAHLEALPLPALGAARRDRLRERTLAALDDGAAAGPSFPWRRLGAAAGVAALVAGLVLWLWPRPSPPPPGPAAPGPAAVAAPGPVAPSPGLRPAPVHAACAEGVWTTPCRRVTGATGVRADLPAAADLWLEPDSVVAFERAAAATRFHLERGRILARVHPRPAGSSFVVAAGDMVVTVRGTLFAVARREQRVQVDLVEGTVTVTVPTGDRALAAGQRAVFAAGQLEVEPLAAARAAADLARLPAAPASTAAPTPPAGSPERYYRRAEAARRAGRSAEAAQAYRGIRRLFPGTAAAANASLALGDLYLGPLHRPAAALHSYDEALAGRPAGAVHEEALAGRARALRALARPDQTRAAAAAYLRHHPAGIHSQEMRALAR
ncbi:MAG: FecR domain-containing protein [Deltaproteobacteria bacterium]|nr:FecR domain-containing protein [Deltaproteobacteria bacterium]